MINKQITRRAARSCCFRSIHPEYLIVTVRTTKIKKNGFRECHHRSNESLLGRLHRESGQKPTKHRHLGRYVIDYFVYKYGEHVAFIFVVCCTISCVFSEHMVNEGHWSYKKRTVQGLLTEILVRVTKNEWRFTFLWFRSVEIDSLCICVVACKLDFTV